MQHRFLSDLNVPRYWECFFTWQHSLSLSLSIGNNPRTWPLTADCSNIISKWNGKYCKWHNLPCKWPLPLTARPILGRDNNMQEVLSGSVSTCILSALSGMAPMVIGRDRLHGALLHLQYLPISPPPSYTTGWLYKQVRGWIPLHSLSPRLIWAIQITQWQWSTRWHFLNTSFHLMLQKHTVPVNIPPPPKRSLQQLVSRAHWFTQSSATYSPFLLCTMPIRFPFQQCPIISFKHHLFEVLKYIIVQSWTLNILCCELLGGLGQ